MSDNGIPNDMIKTDTAEKPAGAAQPPASPSSSARWWVAVIITCVLSFPIGVLLSFAAALPFFIGLFFFALFGLGIGAVANRIASRNRPYSSVVLTIGTTVIVLFVWCVSLEVEARAFPTDMAKRVQSKIRSLGEDSPEAFRAKVADDVRAQIRSVSPPGGTFGYMHWVLTDGELKPQGIHGMKRAINAPQRKVIWAIRVVLSIALLGFGVATQTFTLRLLYEPSSRAIDRAKQSMPPDGSNGHV